MAGEGINISLAEVSKTAATIKSLNSNLYERLQEIKREMAGLAASWQSDGSESIRANFNALEPAFENYKKVVDSYAEFLEVTVQNYNTAETAINNYANQFK